MHDRARPVNGCRGALRERPAACIGLYMAYKTTEPPQPLPDHLQQVLRDKLHFSADQVSRLSRAEAQESVDEFYSQEIRDD